MTEPTSKSKEITDRPSLLAGSKGPEARRSARFPFTATAEVTDLESEATISARTSDLALGGCYIDTMNPLNAGRRIKVRLTKDEKTFEAVGTVRHVQPGMGMGIAFAEISPEGSRLLQSWLAELSGESVPAAKPAASASATRQPPRSERAILNQLIGLLVKKGVLTEPEAAALLRELFS